MGTENVHILCTKLAEKKKIVTSLKARPNLSSISVLRYQRRRYMSSIAHTSEDIRDDCCGYVGLTYNDSTQDQTVMSQVA